MQDDWANRNSNFSLMVERKSEEIKSQGLFKIYECPFPEFEVFVGSFVSTSVESTNLYPQ